MCETVVFPVPPLLPMMQMICAMMTPAMDAQILRPLVRRNAAIRA
ncbi:MAG TPA: hypothetical protein PLV48_13410 [Rhodocyclaceae bacterium]|nr:hypothetical protein [Rhodocyclaceae bacterium]HNH99579.1 hypothetical protein [Rhodocyclaceae bacterium]